jgi:periplasmic protein TonB
MSSLRSSALVSLDGSLALLYESWRKLKAAKSVDTAEVIERLKMSAESAGVVRELVWSELPEASWQDREELDALIEKTQQILDARALEQLRSRLLSLASELERGSIVHRRAHRLDELNHLRDEAVNELRSQAALSPQTLPGPDAAQWIDWACGLQEPQDAESLQILRDGFAHLDDLVANLEPSMWIASQLPTSGTGPGSDASVHKTQLGQSGMQTTGAEKPVASSGPNLADGGSQRKEVAGLTLAENPQLSQPQNVVASIETPAVPSQGPVLSDALALPLASLDKPSALLFESLGRLKAAQPIDIAEVIGQIKLAADSGRIVRALVLSELPQASWQNREDLDALLEKIQEILDVRALETLRARLLSLATELERGSIVHRRAHRLSELNELRDQAVNELRSQAGLEGTAPTLPGPDAGQWIEWACGLTEPEDAESLQALRNGFTHLDDFVANLEFSMWIPAGSPTREALPEPDIPAGKTPAEQSQLEENGLQAPGVSSGSIPMEAEAASSSGGRDEPRFPDLLGELSLPALDSNTLTPNDGTPPRTQEEIQRIIAQEQALLASMMGLVTDPVAHFNPAVEQSSTPEVLRETSAPSPRPAPAPATEPVGHTGPIVERSSTAEVFREANVAPAVPSDLRAGVEEPRGEKWRARLATPAVMVVAALLLLAVLGVILWRSFRSHTSNSPVQAMERKVPDQTGNLGDKGYGQSGVSPVSQTHAASPETMAEKQSKPRDQSVIPNSPLKALPAKQPGKRDDGVLRPPAAISSNVAMANREGSPPSGTAEITGSVPGALPNGAGNSVASIATDIPVPVPKLAAQMIRVSSGVAQGLLVHQVTPKYPPLARQARIQGTVVLHAVIGKDGSVQNLRVLSGHPMLTQAAMDAVRQWHYKPYLVNGEPVEADTQINVNFNLSGG